MATSRLRRGTVNITHATSADLLRDAVLAQRLANKRVVATAWFTIAEVAPSPHPQAESWGWQRGKSMKQGKFVPVAAG